MQPSKFNNLYNTILENMTVATTLGATPTSQFSSDSYAPGDTRIPKILGAKKGKKRKFPIIRRNLPKGM